jgi:hypothetical protein
MVGELPRSHPFASDASAVLSALVRRSPEDAAGDWSRHQRFNLPPCVGVERTRIERDLFASPATPATGTHHQPHVKEVRNL